MQDDDLPAMPWSGIARLTGMSAAAVGVALTAICAAAVRAERRERAEAARFRWTDANRWE